MIYGSQGVFGSINCTENIKDTINQHHQQSSQRQVYLAFLGIPLGKLPPTFLCFNYT